MKKYKYMRINKVLNPQVFSALFGFDFNLVLLV